MDKMTFGMGRRVLVVEDEPAVRASVSEMLTDQGFEVTSAACGDEAAGLIDGAGRFDLLLTDVHIPGRLDGLGVAAHARELQPDLPIVVVTGQPEAQRGIGGLQPRCTMVVKPYGVRAILQAIDSVSA